MANIIKLRKHGPIICEGDFLLEHAGNTYRSDKEALYLCRCGHSANKPFCDGSHKQIEFDELIEFIDDKAADITGLEETATITLRENAMLIVNGPVTIQTEDGMFSTTRTKVALCRCGHSSKKPFCDISHKRCGFIASE